MEFEVKRHMLPFTVLGIVPVSFFQEHFFFFNVNTDSQEVAKMGPRGPTYLAPGFPPWLHLV